MKLSRILFFPLLISLLLNPSPTSAQDVDSLVLGSLSEPMLFKCGFDVMKSHFSGLALFKSMPDSSIRILFLSELGINLLDMKYSRNEFEVVSVQKMLDRKMLLRNLQNDIRTLLLKKPPVPSDSKDQPVKFREMGTKYRFTFGENGEVKHIRSRSACFRKTDYYFERKETVNLNISHRGVKMAIRMTEINRNN